MDTPAGPLRGGKYSAFEGGTRVRLIITLPVVIKPAISDALRRSSWLKEY
jgi:hypothetical protein